MPVPRLPHRDLIDLEYLLNGPDQAAMWPRHADNAFCWCRPRLEYEDPITGAQHWVHRSPIAGEMDS